MKHEIKIHNGYAEWEEAKDEGISIPLMFGKYHHTFSSDEGKISMIKLKNHLGEGDLWEIYCIEGQLFEDTERFDNRKEAMKRIRGLLEI